MLIYNERAKLKCREMQTFDNICLLGKILSNDRIEPESLKDKLYVYCFQIK